MNTKVDEYFLGQNQWQTELKLLRDIILDCGLIETYKWKHPCYQYNKHNVVIIHEFKTYCGITFFKGALLKDTEKILTQSTENMQAARQIRFKSIKQIQKQEASIRAYIYEAIEIEKAGLKVKMKATSDYEVPEELTIAFKENLELEKAFQKLTPGRQRGYLLHFSGAKQAKTRMTRINKYVDRILKGKGLNDCICGLSKRMPNCDGSHNILKKKDN
jgi:uncharacterized protein YdeI (YjbR/CyaY-like superfamily)